MSTDVIIIVACVLSDAGIRVNLSSCETFADLVVSLENSLRSARNHCHYPFGTVAEEVSHHN